MIEKVLISIFIAFIIAQGWKFYNAYLQRGIIDFSTLFQNGGMPSSHTSTTVAMTFALYLETDLSYFFIISFLFTIIVMNDAMKARRETGDEAMILNRMNFDNPYARRLQEKVGHTPLEVFVGAIVGICSTLIIYAVF